MPAPRPSQSAEAARAAAAQAEFNEKKWVWVPDDKDGYLAGWVVKEEEDMGDVVMAAGGEVRVNSGVRRVCGILNMFQDPEATAVCAVEDEPAEVRQSRRYCGSYFP